MSALLQWPLWTSTDAMRGRQLADRVLARKNELEDALALAPPHAFVLRQAIATALTTVYALITCDLAHPPPLVAHQLSRWLERNKHLAQDSSR